MFKITTKSIKTPLLFIFALFVFFAAPQDVKAVTFTYVQTDWFEVEQGVWVEYIVCTESYVANTNKTSYSPGEDIVLTTSYSNDCCANFPNYMRIIASFQGSSITIAVTPGQATLVAPTTPGNYTIILTGAHIINGSIYPKASASIPITVVAPANTAPTVINPTVSSITTTGATLGARVTSLGIPAAISARGTCVGTTPAPTTNCVAQGGTTSGIFTHARTGLASGTTYYYRGYATNTTGTGYSPDGTFTTTAVFPDLTVTGSVTPIVATAGTSASFSATVKNIGTASTGAGFTDLFEISQVSNPPLFSSLYATVATSSVALAAGTSNTVSANYTFPSTGTWYVRACADTNMLNVGSVIESDETNNCGTWTTVTVAPANTVPTVINPTVSSITTTGATLGANVTSLGVPAAISARGTCVGTTPAPTTNCVAQGGTTSGIFTHARTGLTPSTTYYYRGYATNTTGTGYSPDGTFTTSIPAPTFNFYSDDSSVPSGSTTAIHWNGVTNATSCTPSSGSSGWSGVSTSIGGGSWTTGPLTIAGSPYTYALTCTGPGGSVPKGATVTVTVSATCNENGTCEAGENILTCPSDCKTKYQQY